ncbi:MAG: TlpA disulfide reductase family protein [Sulfurospirillaceae bacterium]|nr:TlpA disulfide reductase family protein [Sulfurospirillaceae bacterium]MDD3462994.1 TlpA disulfide reductase family protein [Sulfurospirillaceae bacterium]
MKLYITTLATTLALLFAGCSDKKNKKEEEATSSQAPISKNEISKPITLNDVNGKQIIATPVDKGFKFSDSENKVVLVNFFATWCPPCKAEIPHLNNLQEKYKDKFKIISVLLEDGKPNEEIISFMKYNNINYTVTNGAGNFKLADGVGGVNNIPLMMLYDKNGKYSTHYVGVVPEEMIDSDINKIL